MRVSIGVLSVSVSSRHTFAYEFGQSVLFLDLSIISQMCVFAEHGLQLGDEPKVRVWVVAA